MRARNFWFALTLVGLWLGGAGQATGQTVGVRVFATLADARFYVDGQPYQGTASFSWPAGSKHTLEVRAEFTAADSPDIRNTFSGWTDSSGKLATGGSMVQVVSADPSVAWYQASFTKMFRVKLWLNFDPMVNLYDPSEPMYLPAQGELDPNRLASRSGYVVTSSGAGCLTTSSWVWIADGTLLSLQAVPYPGYVFTGFTMPPQPGRSFLSSITITGPMQIRANFADSRRYLLETSPVRGMRVVVDRNVVGTLGAADSNCMNKPLTPAPSMVPAGPLPYWPTCTQTPLCTGEMDFLPGSQHVLGVPPVQRDSAGRLYVFDNWDLGDGTSGGQNTVITVPDAWKVTTLTANFVHGTVVSFQTKPLGLKLKIDGRDNWQGYNFEWGLGHKHTFAAPAEQVDARGRRYRFTGWSNGGAAEQELVVSQQAVDTGSMLLVANYEVLGQLTVRSDPAGMRLDAGGTECRTPCTLDRAAGTTLTLALPGEVPMTADVKFAFDKWSDGNSSTSRDYAFTTDAAVLTARYGVWNRFTTVSDPEGGASFRVVPAPQTDGYLPSGSKLEVTVEANPGYKFKNWEGALAGSYPTGWLTLSTPLAVLARLDKVPALKDGAVRNAAGETPDAVVAPGSIISIRGYNLAPQYEAGPDSPLAMTLQGATLTLGDRIVPLKSVSPDEILAVLPWDLAEGTQTMTVRPADQAPMKATFQVTRNAPGLFRMPGLDGDVPLAYALHEDGKPVTADSPARAGETVSLYGTGFGPVDPQPLDGFAVPARPPAPLKDTLELYGAGDSRPYTWAGAAPGLVGYSLVKFRVDPSMGGATNVEMRVQINGRASNTVLLPVE